MAAPMLHSTISSREVLRPLLSTLSPAFAVTPWVRGHLRASRNARLGVTVTCTGVTLILRRRSSRRGHGQPTIHSAGGGQRPMRSSPPTMLIHKVLSALLLAGSVLASPVPADGVELDARDDGALHLPARDDTLHLQARDPPYARVRTPLKDAQGRQWWLAVSILSAFPLRNGVRVFLDPTGRRIYTGWAIRDGWKGQIKVASGSQNYCLDAGSCE